MMFPAPFLDLFINWLILTSKICYNPSMRYLLYYQDGFIRKFPLNKSRITVGRAEENDLVIKEEFISRKHLEVFIHNAHIEIRDVGSTNGTFVKGSRVTDAVIRLNESFCLKTCELFLKEGEPDEFQTARELAPIFKQISRRTEDRIKDIETRYIKDASHEVLKQFLMDSLKTRSMGELMLNLSNYLSVFNNFGNLVLAVRNQEDLVYSYRHQENESILMGRILSLDDLFGRPRYFQPVPEMEREKFYSYPLQWHEREAILVYFPGTSAARPAAKTERFLRSLALEIELASRLVPPNGAPVAGRDQEELSADVIHTANPEVKRLIKEAKRIAASELFILIQGESGTGKEIFARLIHAHSNRKCQPLVAINCAAIPENLLESEFFGYEKGAFTDARAMKRGKLELSSGGMLILDEIGEMPLRLQSKLLRALEEHEFFRVGGLIPIKVDLRIIALTNSRLSELIETKKFRSDLYYRLVHHTITLPPLRERREDIPLLINHFTSIYSRQYNKDINGYSVKAFQALKDYSWPGNVRQLKNEVHRLVNLIGESGLIDYDSLSDSIRYPALALERIASLPPAAFDARDEKGLISRMLEKNHGNKSRTARELNITYQGLHKKMKRLGIGNQ